MRNTKNVGGGSRALARRDRGRGREQEADEGRIRPAFLRRIATVIGAVAASIALAVALWTPRQPRILRRLEAPDPVVSLPAATAVGNPSPQAPAEAASAAARTAARRVMASRDAEPRDLEAMKDKLVVAYDWNRAQRPRTVWSKKAGGWLVTVDEAGVIFSSRPIEKGEERPRNNDEEVAALPRDLIREANEFVAVNMPLKARGGGDDEGAASGPATTQRVSAGISKQRETPN